MRAAEFSLKRIGMMTSSRFVMTSRCGEPAPLLEWASIFGFTPSCPPISTPTCCAPSPPSPTRSASPAREVLLAYARRMLTLNDEVMALMRRTTTVASVRIGTPDDYATMLLPEVLARFNASYPDVMVEVVCDNSPDLVAEIERGRYDLALVTQRADNHSGELVRREPVAWVAPPRDPALSRPVEDFDPLPLALFPKGCVVRDLAVDALDRIGRDWRVAFTSKSVVAVHGAILGGLGVTAMEDCTVPTSLRRLDAADGFPALPDIHIALHRAPGALAKPTRLLADAIHDLVGETAR
jgi:DNA-binding transcriptional LysR family regulator